MTWDDIKNHKFNFKRYRLQSQIAIVTSAVLVVLSILYFGLFEYSRPEWADFTFKEKFWATIFTAVTPRTAGFNTTDYNLFDRNRQNGYDSFNAYRRLSGLYCRRS